MYIFFFACYDSCRHFSPSVASVEGLLGVEATDTLKRIASRLATKCQKPYSRMCGYINSRVAVTLVRATHQCIWGSRVPGHKNSVQRSQREDGSGLNLFRYVHQEILRPDDVLTWPQFL